MKLFTNPLTRSLSLAAVATAALVAFQPTAEAKGHHHSSHHSGTHHSGGHHRSGGRHVVHHSGGHYIAHHGPGAYYDGPRHRHHGYVVRWADGWRGPGYYYGPPGVVYYDETPGVTFYASRGALPRGLRVDIRG